MVVQSSLAGLIDIRQLYCDNADEQTVRPSISFALIQELIHRDGLRVALSGRDDVALEPILTFLSKHITDPRFGEMAASVGGVVIGMSPPSTSGFGRHWKYEGTNVQTSTHRC